MNLPAFAHVVLMSGRVVCPGFNVSRWPKTVCLLFFLYVQSVLAQPRAVLIQLQFFAASLSPQRVVVVTRLLAHEKYSLYLSLLLGHGSLLSGSTDEDNGKWDRGAGIIPTFAVSGKSFYRLSRLSR